MRRAERVVAALAATLAVGLAVCAAAAAHPGAKFVAVTNSGYEPESVSVYPSQAVHWTWETVLASRSVTADPGQAESFDSGVKSSGSYEHVFRTPGTYTYRSTQGVAGMGTVVVLPYPTPAPKIKGLRVTNGENPRARFRVNVRGDAVCRIEAREGGGWRTVKSFFKRAEKGRNRFRIPDSSLDPGRHRLTLRLYDRFNRLDTARDTFRL